jgi:hypothetical protein
MVLGLKPEKKNYVWMVLEIILTIRTMAKSNKNWDDARHRWFMPIILPTQEAERSGGLWFKASPLK